MDSRELNDKIAAICDNDDLYEAYGGKAIPYIGWYWRTVNFDARDYMFGILDEGLLGFMENNKWGYSYHYCPAEDWREIVRLLETAVTSPSYDTLKAVNDRIQALRRDREYGE